MFDIRIVNLNTGSYLRMTPEKALAKAEKENKNLYLQACLERKSTFTPMVYSADRIPGAEALAAQKRLDTLLSYKLKREYRETGTGRSTCKVKGRRKRPRFLEAGDHHDV